MKPRFTYLVILVLTLVLMSGCDLLTGNIGSVFIPDPNLSDTDQIPIVDGFDFPVGDRNGQGWAVTGYSFFQWSNYSNSIHPGEDWNMLGSSMADWGKPVYSIGHGLVVFSGWNTAQGNIIQIEHYLPDGNKVWSQYAHLEQRSVQQGDIVGRRQIIGTVGRGPNNAFSPHLHFEIRKQYLPQNAWPKTNGVPWETAKVLAYYLPPTEFIKQNRP